MAYALVCDHGIKGIVNCRPCDRARRAAREAALHARGLTQKGLPYKHFPKGTPALDKVLGRVDRSGACWVFPGARNNGYGIIRDGRTMRYVHAIVYEGLVGPIPKGMQLDHVLDRGCTSRACVNPDHLEPVTPSENMRRMSRSKPPEYHSARMRKAWVTRKAKMSVRCPE